MLMIGFIVIGVILLWGIMSYNGLIKKRLYVKESWGSIDVHLKAKSNILLNLVDTLKMQTEYEGKLLQDLTAARTGMMQGSNEQRMKTSDEVSKLIPSIYAVSENYPQLASSSSFLKLMSSIQTCEEKIAYARTGYNMSVTHYNQAISVFPSSIIAGMFHFQSETLFEITEQQREDSDNFRIKDIS